LKGANSVHYRKVAGVWKNAIRYGLIKEGKGNYRKEIPLRISSLGNREKERGNREARRGMARTTTERKGVIFSTLKSPRNVSDGLIEGGRSHKTPLRRGGGAATKFHLGRVSSTLRKKFWAGGKDMRKSSACPRLGASS